MRVGRDTDADHLILDDAMLVHLYLSNCDEDDSDVPSP